MIKTKSIQKPRQVSDGIRICVMRRVKPEFDFDIWILPLSPSTKLLKSYHEKEISWEEYEHLFAAEVFFKQEKYMKIINDMALQNTITLLCWEEIPDNCHRRLIAEELQRNNTKLTVRIS